ncbi:hypothetical protein IU438_18720 [Nocardia cyriacigeorgica]|uniref:hypothetical protein n=1 Tax=Nocardia cyriacigeorgica TaxID=135487 RepID=UPI001893A8F3|nr:hypothetical protein [Nocardia cyriacigeorgica]MBF6397826.1 hypothetical protein [Nocardia cyriacigeorgica]MBF6402516.1 hypothetical protein [Nocardia cyriacigeorgica]
MAAAQRNSEVSDLIPAYATGSAANVVPVPDESATRLFVEVLSLELWHLERMAFLAATCADRIPRSRWRIHVGVALEQRFEEAMVRRWERVEALARAADLTAAEADALWDAGAEGVRRVHAVAVRGWTEQTLTQEWINYASNVLVPAIPTPATARADTARVCAPIVPPPQQMIATARMELSRTSSPRCETSRPHPRPPQNVTARSAGTHMPSASTTGAPEDDSTATEAERATDTGPGP